VTLTYIESPGSDSSTRYVFEVSRVCHGAQLAHQGGQGLDHLDDIQGCLTLIPILQTNGKDLRKQPDQLACLNIVAVVRSP